MAEVRESFGFPLSISVLSDVGRVRTNNEDSFGYRWLDDGSLFVIVADGMGGHEAGEVASGLAVQVVEDAVSENPDIDPRERLYNGLLEANEAILDEGRRSGTRGMGTTAICSVFKGEQAYISVIGDSRFYHVRKGQLVWRTLDHTRVQMLIDQGEITEEDSKTHPEAGMLTRALGHNRMADGRPLVPDVLAEPVSLEEYDTIVMCSDGCHDLIDDWEIAQLVAGRTGEEAAEALVDLACDRGGHDNVTVAVIIAGKRGMEYDPDFVPESHEYYEEDEVESTYDGYEYEEPQAAPPPMAAAPPPPAEQGGNTGMILGVSVVLLLALIALLLFLVIGFGVVFFALG